MRDQRLLCGGESRGEGGARLRPGRHERRDYVLSTRSSARERPVRSCPFQMCRLNEKSPIRVGRFRPSRDAGPRRLRADRSCA